jgi:hypothetical protein
METGTKSDAGPSPEEWEQMRMGNVVAANLTWVLRSIATNDEEAHTSTRLQAYRRDGLRWASEVNRILSGVVHRFRRAPGHRVQFLDHKYKSWHDAVLRIAGHLYSTHGTLLVRQPQPGCDPTRDDPLAVARPPASDRRWMEEIEDIRLKASEWLVLEAQLKIEFLDVEARSRVSNENNVDPEYGGPLEVSVSSAAGSMPRVREIDPTEPKVEPLTIVFLDQPEVPRPTLVLRLKIGLSGKPEEFRITGKTRANLAKLVIEQADQSHTWKDLLKSGMKAGYWTITSPESLERAGRRIRNEVLPPQLRGCWDQDGTSVRWSMT